MIFPRFCEMMTFPQNFSLLIATFQEIPLSITFFAALFAGGFLEKKKKIYPYTYCPLLLSVPTIPALDFLLLSFSFTIFYPSSLNKNTHLEIACNSEKQELRYLPTLVFHIS